MEFSQKKKKKKKKQKIPVAFNDRSTVFYFLLKNIPTLVDFCQKYWKIY